MKAGRRTEGRPYWRVFYTAARAEKKCEQRLEEQGIEVFLPKRTVLRQWKDRKKEVVEPLFKNYLFAHVDERERLQVLRTPGIVRCVGFGSQPAVLSEEEIEQVKIAQREPHRLTVVDLPRVTVGEQVVVVAGPLQGLSGEVVKQEGQNRIILCIPAIRQALSVHVPAAWIRPKDTRRTAA